MKEFVTIENQNGPLEIIGGKYDSALLLNGEPIQFTFIREIGSTWRYQIAKSISESDIIQDKKFSNFVKFGYLSNVPLSNQFKYIIDKLGQGNYEIELTDISTDINLVESNCDAKSYYHFDTYGGLIDLIETQSSYNEQIIEEYSELIRNGKKPTMVVIKSKSSDNTFILDGHHKFIAYSRLKQDARALVIIKLDSKKIDKKIGLELFKKCGSENAEYKKWFLKQI